VNDKKAKVIRANDNIIYAIVPSRADTGYVRLYLKKGEEFEEFTSENYIYISLYITTCPAVGYKKSILI